MDDKKKIVRCIQCWASRPKELTFTCIDCKRIFCHLHSALPGLYRCIACFDFTVKAPLLKKKEDTTQDIL